LRELDLKKNKAYVKTRIVRMEASEEYVILVDENDNPIGTEEKVRCHLPDGLLHRAFTALLFEEDTRRLILGRRAPSKMLWPGCWDGTFASHPRESETYVSSCERRMPEELGTTTSFDYIFKFEYHVPYKEIGSENEICGTLAGTVPDVTALSPTRGEIDFVEAVTAGELADDLVDNPMSYCPWLLVALYMLDLPDPAAQRHCGPVLDAWGDGSMRGVLLEAIEQHMPRSAWRLIPQ